MEEPIKKDVDETTAMGGGGIQTPVPALDAKNNVYEEDCGCDDCEDCNDKIDETTSALSGTYVGPFRKKGSNHVTDKPAWHGGEMIGESYLTNGNKFKLIFESLNEEDPCWDGYEQVGMKEKDGKEVPNCVPVDEDTNDDSVVPMAEASYYSQDIPVSREEQERALADIKRNLENLLNTNTPNVENSEAYKYMVDNAQKIAAKLGRCRRK